MYSEMMKRLTEKADALRLAGQHQRAAYLEKLGARMMDAHDNYLAAYENAKRETNKPT